MIMNELRIDEQGLRAPMLAIKRLRKVYDGSGRMVEAIRDVTFSLNERELVCIVGPSGAGKTTLLRCIADCCSRPAERSNWRERRWSALRREWPLSSRNTAGASFRG